MKAVKVINQNGRRIIKIGGHVFVSFGRVGFGAFYLNEDILGRSFSIRIGIAKILFA